jgi:hypothetical protein
MQKVFHSRSRDHAATVVPVAPDSGNFGLTTSGRLTLRSGIRHCGNCWASSSTGAVAHGGTKMVDRSAINRFTSPQCAQSRNTHPSERGKRDSGQSPTSGIDAPQVGPSIGDDGPEARPGNGPGFFVHRVCGSASRYRCPPWAFPPLTGAMRFMFRMAPFW